MSGARLGKSATMKLLRFSRDHAVDHRNARVLLSLHGGEAMHHDAGKLTHSLGQSLRQRRCAERARHAFEPNRALEDAFVPSMCSC